MSAAKVVYSYFTMIIMSKDSAYHKTKMKIWLGYRY